MTTVREDLVEALEDLVAAFDHEHWPIALAGARTVARLALARARAVQSRPNRESTCPDCGTECPCYQEGANEGHSTGCNDDSCACWAAGHQEGLEAQREPAGGGTV